MRILILVSTIKGAVIVEYDCEYGNTILVSTIKGAVIVEYDC